MSEIDQEIIVPYDLGYYIAIRDEPQLPNMDDNAQIDFVAPYEQMVLNVCNYHTNQTLDRLKEGINERKQSIEASYDKGEGKKVFSAPQLESIINELKYVLNLIEEVSDE